ncbi:MAG TPA: RidA family protein [Gemmatimonadota bacterium]|nr:RidA family protein [Gemmatimonadota bacterium]
MAKKKAKGLGMAWEDDYGYAQAVKVGKTIYVSGQLSHDDEGNFVAPAPLDDVVEEVLHVTDMDAAFAVAGLVRKEAYGSEKPDVASTILVTPRLAFPAQLIEIKFLARV